MLDSAKNAALDAIKPHIQRLSERAVEATVRHNLMQQLPRRKDIAVTQPISVTIDVPKVVTQEAGRLQQACDAVISLRSSLLVTPCGKRQRSFSSPSVWGFKPARQYEGAVRKLLVDDGEALEFVRGLFGALLAEITKA